jgi:hypothetical protein
MHKPSACCRILPEQTRLSNLTRESARRGATPLKKPALRVITDGVKLSELRTEGQI